VGNNVKFFEAISGGDLTRVKSMLDNDPELLTSRDEQGVSPILAALYHHQREVLGELIMRVPKLDIWEASATGHLLQVEEILGQDRSLLNAFSPDGFTALGLAAFFGRKAILEELVRRGADVNIPSNNLMRVQALHSAVAHQNTSVAIQMARLLLERGAEVNASQTGGWRPLHEAAMRGNIELIKLLLHWGADPNAENDEGKTPLDMAIQSGDENIISLLRG